MNTIGHMTGSRTAARSPRIASMPSRARMASVACLTSVACLAAGGTAHAATATGKVVSVDQGWCGSPAAGAA